MVVAHELQVLVERIGFAAIPASRGAQNFADGDGGQHGLHRYELRLE